MLCWKVDTEREAGTVDEGTRFLYSATGRRAREVFEDLGAEFKRKNKLLVALGTDQSWQQN